MSLAILLVLASCFGSFDTGATLLPPGAGAQAAGDTVRANDNVEGEDHEAARDGVNEGRLIPLSEVKRKLEAIYEGRMLDASLHELVPGEPVYRVIWLLPDDRRLAIWVDAITGEVLRVEGA